MSRNETKIVDHSEQKLFFRSSWMCPALAQRIVENEAKELDECVSQFLQKFAKAMAPIFKILSLNYFPLFAFIGVI